jgi:hypothetical protein
MGSIRNFNPVKLFIGVLLSDKGLLPIIRERLIARFGMIDHESPIIPFVFTDYYSPEMGAIIDRLFFSFERLIDADELAEIKRRTNTLEEEFSSEQTGQRSVKRPVNLDPGYLEHAKVILASTKNFYHRIYLGRGIFAEVTMHFKNNTFQFFPWTYPDYQSKEYQEFFLRIRHIYRSQLKTMCNLNREEHK